VGRSPSTRHRLDSTRRQRHVKATIVGRRIIRVRERPTPMRADHDPPPAGWCARSGAARRTPLLQRQRIQDPVISMETRSIDSLGPSTPDGPPVLPIGSLTRLPPPAGVKGREASRLAWNPKPPRSQRERAQSRQTAAPPSTSGAGQRGMTSTFISPATPTAHPSHASCREGERAELASPDLSVVAGV
jgi:hypothetical protein